MDYIQENHAEKFVIGIQIRTSNEECMKTMPALWQKFFKDGCLEKIPNRTNQEILAVMTAYEADHTKPYTYIVGCQVSSLDIVPEDMVSIVIPASSYAVYRSQGPFPTALQDAWRAIWESGLPRSYLYDFEVYSPGFNPSQECHVPIYIGLTPSA